MAHLPLDRLQALISGRELPLHSTGTIVFADIAGFTPLTERLMRSLGSRRGAEELTRLLDLVYDPLISLVHAYGGSVIGFSGDAITTWFPGADAQPALACGLAMQQVMAAFAAIPLPIDPPVTLSLKVSIASGPVQRFVVGDPAIQQIDVLAGAPLTSLAAIEHLAMPGEVLVSADLAAALAGQIALDGWRSDPAHDVRAALVSGLRQPVAPGQPDLDWDTALVPESLPSWVAPGVLARLQHDHAPFLTELRPVVALFLRFGDAAVASQPALLNGYIAWVQNVLARYEATLIQVTIGEKGNYLYAAFGAPIAHEDDAVRAVRAALELRHSPVAAIGAVQIGIAQGIARTGLYGGRERRTYGVLGDAVNLAARLMQAAQPGQIIANDQVWSATGGHVQWQILPPLTVKGKPTPLLVASLLGAAAPRPASAMTASPLPLAGRTAELGALSDLLEQAPPHAGQAIAITGAAGIGKSRLVLELLRDLPATWLIWQSATQSYGTASPYLCWIPIWQRVFAVDPAAALEENLARVAAALTRLAPASLPQLPLLGAVLGLAIPENDLTRALDPRLRKAWLETLLVQCLRAELAAQRTAGQRLLLVLEDLHWIDQLSADLLAQIGASLDTLPISLVLTARPVDESTPGLRSLLAAAQAREVRLGELAPDAISQLLTDRLAGLGQQLSPEGMARLSAQITQQAAGNPFYAEELITYLSGAGVALDDRHGWQNLELPVGLHRLVLSRVDRLDERQQRVLKTASILGASFRRAWLADFYPALGGPAAVAAAIATLEQADLLAPSAEPEVCRFKHAITREVTYESLAHASRGQLHEQCASHLEQAAGAGDDHLDLLAYHYARSPNDPKAIVYLARNAARAAGLFANDDAVHQYRAALERAAKPAVDSPLPRSELARGLGDVYAQMAEFDQALEQYAQARAALADAALERAQLDLSRADVLVRATRFDAALDVIAQTEADVQAASSGVAWMGRVVLAQLANLRSIKEFRQGDMKQALAWAEQGLHQIETLPNDAEHVATTRIRLSQSLVAAAAMVGDHQRAQKVLKSALRLIRRHPNPVVEGELQLRKAVLSMNRGRLALAVRQFRQALPLIEATGTRDRVGQLLIGGGRTLTLRGEFQEARAWFQRAVQLGEATGATFLVSAGLHLLGWLDMMTGEWEAALSHLRSGKELAVQHDLRDRLASLMIFESQIYMYRGDYGACDALFGQALELALQHKLDDQLLQCHHNMAFSALMQDQMEIALSYRKDRRFTADPVQSFEEALDLLSSAEWWAMIALAGAAEILPEEAELVAATSWNSVVFLRQHGYRYSLPFAYRVHAMVAYTLGDLEDGWNAASQGVRIGRSIGRVPELARSLVWRARAELARAPGSGQATRDLGEAAQYFEQLGARPELAEISRLLAAGT
jgi:class 3 adenylate cyclase/predicted ATPase